MKTAISMPDLIFHQASDRAASLGISRSEFFVDAVRCYLRHLDSASVTDQINAVLDAAPDESSQVASAAGRRRLDDAEW